MSIIDSLPLTDLRCLVCGAKAGACDCWVVCSCGWSARKHQPCGNPNTTRCSTKLMYGPKRKKKKAGVERP